MKALFVIPYYFPKVGGLENYARNIGIGLKQKYEWEITVICSNHQKNIRTVESIDGIKIYRLPRWFTISNTPINFLWFYDVYKIIKHEKPDLINGHTPVPFISDVAAIVSKLLKVPYILTYQNDLVKTNIILSLMIKMYYLFMGSITFRISNKIITTTRYFYDHASYISAYKNKITVIPPGIYMNTDHREKKLVKNAGSSILFVGQLDKTHRHKGLEILMDAIATLKPRFSDILLTIVGRGDYLEQYQAYAKQINILHNVKFTGFLDENELSRVYERSRVVVLPSISESEGFGIVLLEAAIHRKPVVATKIGGIPYVLDDLKNGILVKPADAGGIADALKNLLTDTTHASILGERGHEKVIKDYTWDMQVKKTQQIFRSI